MKWPDRGTVLTYFFRLTLALLVVTAALLLGGAAVFKYQSLQSDWAFDLAFFHSLIYNASAGAGFTQTASLHELDGLKNLSHAFFMLAAVAPVYALLPKLGTLLWVQAFALASGGWPAARLCRVAGGSWPLSIVVALAYLLSFPFWRLGLADFRPLIFLVPALLWLALVLASRRPVWVAMLTLLACVCREEAPILVVALTMGLWLGRRTDRVSALVAINLSLAYFVLIIGYRPRMDYYVPFSKPLSILDNLRFSLPEGVPWDRPLSHLQAYLPWTLAFALLEPLVLLGALPLLAYLFMVSPYEWWQWEGAYIHHAGPLLAFVTIAAALALGRMEAKLVDRFGGGKPAILQVILMGGLSVLLSVQAKETFPRVKADLGLMDGDQVLAERAAQLKALAPIFEAIKESDSVATDYKLMARLSGRQVLYCYQGPFGPESQERGLGRPIPTLKDVNVVVVFAGHGAFMKAVEAEGFKLINSAGGYVYYRRG